MAQEQFTATGLQKVLDDTPKGFSVQFVDANGVTWSAHRVPKDDAEWPYIGRDEAAQVEKKPRAERSKCRHTNTKTVIGPTPGGWPGICLDCGARWR